MEDMKMMEGPKEDPIRLDALFPDSLIDLTEYDTYEQIIPQANKSSADTLKDPIIEIFLPYEGRGYIRDVEIFADISRITVAGADVVDAATTATS